MKRCLLFFLLSAGVLHAQTGDVERLVRELGAEDHRVRDRTEAALRQLGREVVPQLRAQQGAADPEIRWRVGRLLAVVGPDVRGFLASKGTCRGEAREGEAVWPCVIVIKELDPATGAFTGTVEWTSLHALHTIEGKLEAEQLVYREVKFLRRGNAMLNCVYADSLKPTGHAGLLTGT